MLDRRRSGGELDTATRVRPIVIGSVFAVFMCAVVTFAVIAMPGNNAAPRGLVVAVGKGFAAAGKSVCGPDQRPDDDQNPSYVRKKSLAQFSLTIS